MNDKNEKVDKDYVIKLATIIYESGNRLQNLIENYLLFTSLHIESLDPIRITNFDFKTSSYSIIEMAVNALFWTGLVQAVPAHNAADPPM